MYDLESIWTELRVLEFAQRGLAAISMTDADGRTQTIERLRSLLNRLTADDLTLAEADLLRAQILGMLSDSDPGVDAGTLATAPVDHGSSPLRLRGLSTMACDRVYC